MYLGQWAINDFLTFPANTHAAATGAATDATGSPAYRVYEDETATPILSGAMTKLDDANTTGFYTERIELTAANGFEVEKTYTIYIAATVSAIEGTNAHTFKVTAASGGTTPAAVWAHIIEGTLTAEQMQRIILSGVGGLTTDGGIKFRDVADTKDRIDATVDGSGNRSTIALDGT